MLYRVQLAPKALKQLKRIDKKQAERIVIKLNSLAKDPYPTAAKQLIGSPYFRLRVGDYRAIYEIENATITVYVLDVGHRREIYRNL